MITRRTWTTEEMRDLSRQIGQPPLAPFLVDQIKAALIYAADLIDAAEFVIAEKKDTAP